MVAFGADVVLAAFLALGTAAETAGVGAVVGDLLAVTLAERAGVVPWTTDAGLAGASVPLVKVAALAFCNFAK